MAALHVVVVANMVFSHFFGGNREEGAFRKMA